MRKEVKDLYLCILCPNGYVRGLRERYIKSPRISKSYAEAMFQRSEADKMNAFVKKNNILARGIKNQAVLVVDLDICLSLRSKITQIFEKIVEAYDIKILGISKFAVQELEEQFLHGTKGIFFKQINDLENSFSVKYIISNSSYTTCVFIGNKNIFELIEEDAMYIPIYSADDMINALVNEYFEE